MEELHANCVGVFFQNTTWISQGWTLLSLCRANHARVLQDPLVAAWVLDGRMGPCNDGGGSSRNSADERRKACVARSNKMEKNCNHLTPNIPSGYSKPSLHVAQVPAKPSVIAINMPVTLSIEHAGAAAGKATNRSMKTQAHCLHLHSLTRVGTRVVFCVPTDALTEDQMQSGLCLAQLLRSHQNEVDRVLEQTASLVPLPSTAVEATCAPATLAGEATSCTIQSATNQFPINSGPLSADMLDAVRAQSNGLSPINPPNSFSHLCMSETASEARVPINVDDYHTQRLRRMKHKVTKSGITQHPHVHSDCLHAVQNKRLYSSTLCHSNF